MNASTQDIKTERLWAIGIGIFAALLLVAGPIQVVFPAIETLLVFVSLVLLGVSAWRLRNGLPSQFAVWVLAILSAGLLLMGAQLVPLPAEVWSALPGRQVVLDTFTAAKITAGYAPFSMDAALTRAVVLYIIPGIALLFASISIKPECRRDVMSVLIFAAVVCALMGLEQRFRGASTSFEFFPNTALNSTSKGTFQNRNFFAAQLYCSIPLVTAFAVSMFSRRQTNRFLVVGVFFCIFITLVAALGASGSRAGLGLGMLAVVISCALIWKGRNKDEKAAYISRYILPLGFIALLLISQFGLVALLRIAEVDPANDMRGIFAATTIEAIEAYFPAGSGFGTFVPIYKLFEHPEHLMPQFVNNAHNDWLQLALEGGLPMMVLLAGFVVWFLVAASNVWWNGASSLEDSLLRATTIIIFLLLIHSLFDYPLRTRALMGLFAVSCGFLAYGVHSRPLRRRQRSSRAEVLQATKAQKEPRPNRPSPFFARKSDKTHQ